MVVESEGGIGDVTYGRGGNGSGDGKRQPCDRRRGGGEKKRGRSFVAAVVKVASEGMVAEERVDGEGGGMEMVQMVAEVALVPVRYGVVESGEKNLTVVGVKMAWQSVPRRGAMARRS